METVAGSTLRATAVKCPECGATLAVSEGATNAVCQYCGTPSRVQRRTVFFQRPVQLPPPAAHEPVRIAQQMRSTGTLVALVLVPVLAPIVALVGVFVAVHLAHGSSNWSSRAAPLAIDVDGDHVQDYVGWDRSISPDEMRLAAFSGSDGHALWKTDSLGDFSSVQQAAIATAGKLVLVGDEHMRLRAYQLATGSAAWSVTPEEGVDLLCDGDAAHARMVTKDHKVWTVALADGAITASPAGKCQWGDWRDMGTTDLPVAGMSVSSHRDLPDGGLLELGTKSPGTPIPMIAAFVHGKLAWSAQVPGHDPTTASGQPIAGASARAVAVVYGRGGIDAPEVTLFDRATGKRLWETVADKSFMNVVSGVTITDSSVAVSLWGSLHVFELATGKHRFTVGD